MKRKGVNSIHHVFFHWTKNVKLYIYIIYIWIYIYMSFCLAGKKGPSACGSPESGNSVQLALLRTMIVVDGAFKFPAASCSLSAWISYHSTRIPTLDVF